jgi:small subunit ribosomal protein S6
MSNNQLRGYETTLITHSDMTELQLRALKDKIAAVITSFQGQIVLTEDWGKKKFAYPIQKQIRGVYTYLVYEAAPTAIHEIERNLKLNEHVLRFLTVNFEGTFNADQFKKQRQAYLKRHEEEKEARREEKSDKKYYEPRNNIIEE